MTTLALGDNLGEASSLVHELEKCHADVDGAGSTSIANAGGGSSSGARSKEEKERGAETERAFKALRRLHNLTFVKERSLMAQFFPHLVRFHHLSPEGKAWLIEVIENVATSHPDLMSCATSTWLDYLSDPSSNQTLVQRTLSSLARLYPSILNLLTTATFPSPALWSLWNAVKEITGKAFTLVEERPTLRLTFAAINFIMAVIITQSEPNQSDKKAIFRPSLLQLKPNAVLQEDTLTAQAPKMIRVLLDRLRTAGLPSSEVVLTISSLNKVFLRRHIHAPLIMEKLLKFLPWAREQFSAGVLPSIEKVVRMAMFTAVRGRCPFDWTKEFEKTLWEFGGKALSQRYKSNHINRSLAQNVQDDAAGLELSSLFSRPASSSAPSRTLDVRSLLQAGMPPINKRTPHLQSKLDDVASLRPPAAADLVLNLINTLRFPPELSPLNLVRTTDMDAQLMTLLKHVQNPSPDQIHAHLRRSGVSGISTTRVSRDTNTERTLGTKRKANSELHDPRAMKRQAVSLELQDLGPYSAETTRMLLDSSFQSILDAEQSALTAGQIPLRTIILCRLASNEGVESSIGKSLWQFIMEKPTARMMIAQQWLFTEHAISPARYSSLVTTMVDDLVRADIEHSVLVNLLQHLPEVVNDTLLQLTTLCLQHSLTEPALIALMTLAQQYPAQRQAILKAILTFTTHQDQHVRTSAIRLVASEMLTDLFYTTVEEFARGCFTSLADSSKADAMEIDQVPSDHDEVDQQLLLFFAICAKRPHLLGDIASTYIRASKPVRQAILNRIPGLASNINMGDPSLHHLLRTFEEKAKTLIFHMLNSLTQTAQSKQPTPELVAVVREVYTQRIQDPILLLPVLSGLPRDMVISELPAFIRLDKKPRESFLNRMLFQVQSLSVTELLVQLHLIESTILLKKVMAAVDYCLSKTSVVKPELIATALNQLVDHSPLPKLLLRTVIKIIETWSKLHEFLIGLLHRLVQKKVWESEMLWKGFTMSTKMLHPKSMEVVFTLPHDSFQRILQQYHKNDKTAHYLDDFFSFASQYPTLVTKENRMVVENIMGKEVERMPDEIEEET